MPLSIWIAVPLIVHGLAHASGFVATWTARDVGFADRSWVFSPAGSLHSSVGHISGLVWLAAALTLVGAGSAVLASSGIWPQLALVGACLSLAAILPWWRSVPPGARLGVVFDLLILYAVLQHLLDWVPGVTA